MTQDEQKQAVAREAIKYVVDDAWIGVGSGSTANLFIDELAKIKHRIKGTVSSSVKSSERLKSHGIDVEELNNVDDIPVYIDGADEVTRARRDDQGRRRRADAREDRRRGRRASSSASSTQSKLVDVLGAFPLPVEVIPMARSYVARELVKLGRAAGACAWASPPTTATSSSTCTACRSSNPVELEDRDRRRSSGVVTVGLFARRGADVILMGTDAGVQTLTPGPAEAAHSNRRCVARSRLTRCALESGDQPQRPRTRHVRRRRRLHARRRRGRARRGARARARRHRGEERRAGWRWRRRSGATRRGSSPRTPRTSRPRARRDRTPRSSTA